MRLHTIRRNDNMSNKGVSEITWSISVLQHLTAPLPVVKIQRNPGEAKNMAPLTRSRAKASSPLKSAKAKTTKAAKAAPKSEDRSQKLLRLRRRHPKHQPAQRQHLRRRVGSLLQSSRRRHRQTNPRARENVKSKLQSQRSLYPTTTLR